MCCNSKSVMIGILGAFAVLTVALLVAKWDRLVTDDWILLSGVWAMAVSSSVLSINRKRCCKSSDDDSVIV